MKINFNLNNTDKNKSIQFQGYLPVKSNKGNKEYEFNYIYDPNKYNCYLELFSVEKDNNGNWFVTGEDDGNGNIKQLQNLKTGDSEIKLDYAKATAINPADFGLSKDQPFAYHYKLVPKKGGSPLYKLDAGVMIDESYKSGRKHEVYNILTDRTSSTPKGGAMKLILPDNNNVTWVFDDNNNIIENPNIERARKTNKTYANKIGGSLAGIIKGLKAGEFDNYTKIITTPLFTDDSVSSHGYWNKNCFQMAHSLGNINNYAELQKILFAKGINLVSDGAFVNEGLEGVHFSNMLKWGEQSPYFNWFRISGLQNSPLSLGVFGKDIEHVTHRLVNSKYNYEQKSDGTVKISKNHSYESHKPTYIQIYDDRLVDGEKLSSKELIKAYDKLIENNLDINNHNDTVVPYSFQIDSETYKTNIERLNEYNKSAKNKINLKSGIGTRTVTTFKFFGLDGKHENGFETWDANTDIPKLNFVLSHSDTQTLKNIANKDAREEKLQYLKQGTMQTQDYAVSSAKYWTNKTKQILTLNAAQHLANIEGESPKEIYNKIHKLSDGSVFPKNLDVSESIVKNVLRNRYEHNDTQLSFNNLILKGLMDVPLDSIELGDDIAGVLASPFITKRATKEDQIGASRFEMYNLGNPHLTEEFKETYELTDKMYTTSMQNFANEILKNLETKTGALQDEYGNPTEYAKHIIPLLTAEIARFAVIKALVPDAKFNVNPENGEISYDYKALKNTSLLSVGVANCSNPQEEAQKLIKRINNKINHISNTDKEKLTEALWKSIEGTTAESFKLADMIVDRSHAGLDWRIDATKDIADIESVRRGKTDFEYTWNEIIKFWSKFTSGVKEFHPDAYIAAELTDEGEIYGDGDGGRSGSRYSNVNEAVKKLINEAGFTTTANYSYLSSDITEIFGNLFDYNGYSPEKGTEHSQKVLNQLKAFIDSGAPLESIIYSYTFAGNHDKCRALDGFATDMCLAYEDLTDNGNVKLQKKAYRILNGLEYEPDDNTAKAYDYRRVNGLAIAKCESISSGIGRTIENYGQPRKDEIDYQLRMALKNISNGKHLGKNIDTYGFGSKDYDTALDIVLDEMAFVDPDKKLTDEERNYLKKEAFKNIVDPAISKLLGQIKYLTALSGNPTLFSGDEYGSTGYETKTKNMTLQNRNIVHEEWAEEFLDEENQIKNPEFKEFIKTHKEEIDEIFKLRKREELHPLNDGTPYLLKPQHIQLSEKESTKVSAVLRQSPNGDMTISLFNARGLNHTYDKYYTADTLYLDALDLSYDPDSKLGLEGGLKPGTKFISADKDAIEFYVNDKNQLTRAEDHNKKPIGPIEIKDSTLILYNKPSFTGRRVLYNPQYNFVSNPYAKPKSDITGKNLSLVSKM